MTQYYVGVDISKDTFNFCIINEKAQILKKGSLPQSSEGFQDFLSIISPFPNSIILIESSARYHIPLVAFLIDNNFIPFIINPKYTYRFHQFISSTNPSKTDTKDAYTIALFALKNAELLKPSQIPTSAKIIARTISQIKHKISQTKTQILNCLTVLFPEAEKHFNVFSKIFLNILLSFPSAKAISKTSLKNISSIFNKTSKGANPSFTPEEVYNLAKNSTGIHHKGYAKALIFYIKELLFLESELTNLEDELEEEIKRISPDDEKLLSSIKGISQKMSRLFLSEIEDIKRFKSSKSLIKYAGTDPVIKQSGKWKEYRGISKNGSPYLRNILYQMATGVVMWNKVFRAYYLKKKAQFGSHKKAMIAVVNKLIRVIWAILTKREPFKTEKVAPSSQIPEGVVRYASHF